MIPREIDPAAYLHDLRRRPGDPGGVDQHADHRRRHRGQPDRDRAGRVRAVPARLVGAPAAAVLLPADFLIYPGLVPELPGGDRARAEGQLLGADPAQRDQRVQPGGLRAFFQNLPQELLDSARIDGAGEFRILTRIVLPLSKAVIAVVGLFYAVGYWNVCFNALLYIDDNDKFPIQRVLQSYILAGQTPNTSGGSGRGDRMPPTLAIKMAVVVVTVAPIVAGLPVRAAALHQGRDPRRDQGLTLPG